jgi:prolyl-tRNA synthetase
MRRTAFFCRTLRESPAEVDTAGQQWLLRGGYVQPLASGIFSLLPLGQRVRARVEQASSVDDVRMPDVEYTEHQRYRPERAECKERNDDTRTRAAVAHRHE